VWSCWEYCWSPLDHVLCLSITWLCPALPYLSVYKLTFYSLKIGPKHHSWLVHWSKTEFKKKFRTTIANLIGTSKLIIEFARKLLTKNKKNIFFASNLYTGSTYTPWFYDGQTLMDSVWPGELHLGKGCCCFDQRFTNLSQSHIESKWLAHWLSNYQTRVLLTSSL